TRGRDIVFAEGAYAPASQAGRRLLAHELVHVLQQRSAIPRPPSCHVPVGDPQDDCESEADRLAGEALGARVRSAVTPDAAGAIRRAIRAIDDTAKLWIDTENSWPATSIVAVDDLAYLHLSRNKENIFDKSKVESERDASAVVFMGHVEVE